MQEIYWKKLTQSKYALCYFDANFSRCVKIDRFIKIFCAVASSAAIAAWAAWQNLSFWWGLIIVISQVVTAVNEVLPYKKRIKELSDLISELTPIYNNMERSWHDVANGSLTEEEINDSAAKEDNQTKSANENAENEDSATKESDTDELTAVKEELKQLKDSYLRKVAEFENYKKRTLKEKTELILNGSEKTIVAILPVLDDFERAMADKSDDPKVIKEGMQLIFNKFNNINNRILILSITNNNFLNTSINNHSFTKSTWSSFKNITTIFIINTNHI